MRTVCSLRVVLLAGTAALVAGPALAQATAPAATPPAADASTNQPAPTPDAAAPTAAPGAQPAAGDTTSLQEIVVTGNTSGKRTLFNSSSDVTLANTADLLRKAPRSTADVLELVPGIFVQGTAGPVSNNYSVRGLGGGGQEFITLEEDGMPIIYQGGGADEYFQNDITIDRVEAVEGGTSGVLAPNGAGATINFISLKPNFEAPEASVRFTGTTYGDYRADGYYSAPITDSLAFNIGGYVDSNKGVRRNPFSYNTYHVKAMLEKKFDGGGFVRLTVKRGDEHDPYYADMPFHVDPNNGNIESIPGLNLKTDDVSGNAFSNIQVPDSCATGHCLRTFSAFTGLHTKTQQYRIDIEKPITDSLSGFVHARYLKASFDFNGIFPGSTGNTPFPASTYLDPANPDNPIASLEQKGQAIFGPQGATHFGIRDTQGGAIISSTDTAALAALNGNGQLQETVLNHALTKRQDFGSDFGVKWNYQGGAIDNSLTVGGMVYRTHQFNDQSGVTTVINGVSNNSHIYDIVALNAAGGVVGQLTNNGMISYGNWGQGVFKDDITSLSGYFNDELKIGSKLHIDFGARYENEHDVYHAGNAYVTDPTVPAGTPGIVTDLGQSFNGTYTRYSKTFHDWAYTAGLNYALTDNISLYGRYARGFQTNGAGGGIDAATGMGTATFNKPADLTLYEGGIRGQMHGFSGSVVAFRTLFNNQSYQFNNVDNPAESVNAVADDKIWGIQVNATWKPVRFFSLDVNGVYQKPTLTSLQIAGAQASQYSGNATAQTPKKLLTVTPSFILPGGMGEIYGRWKYIDKIFADAGNGVSLPSYSVFTVGGSFNVGSRFNIGVSVDNITNAKGFTEGNPRQGQTQSITNGYFYGRAIVGRNALVTGTVKL